MVKLKLKHLKLAFIIAGTTIGSGFITGRELVRFFGTKNFVPAVYTACVLLFFFSYILMDIGRRFGNLNMVNKIVFKRFYKVVELFTYFSLIVIGSGMLAGIDVLFNSAFKLSQKLFVGSLTGVIAAKIISKKGLDSLAKISVILVPLMLAFMFYFLLSRKKFSYTYSPDYCAFNTFVMAAFYPSMNMFLAAPVLINAGSKYKYGLKTSAICAAACLFLCIILILSAICYEGANALNAEMPLLYISKGSGIVASLFSISVFIAAFSSLVSSYYPLENALSKTRAPKLNTTILIVLMLVLSRLGLSGIVKYFYPILGAFGLLYIMAITLYALSQRGLVFPLNREFFNKRDQKVHKRGKCA